MPLSPSESTALYHRIGTLLADTPDLGAFDKDWKLPASTVKWLAQATALVAAGSPLASAYPARIEFAVQKLTATIGTEQNAREIVLVLNQVMAVLELNLPSEARGAFVSAGDTFDAYSAIASIIGDARERVMIVDPYMDASVVTDFAGLVASGVHLRLLSDQETAKPTLQPAALRWIDQYGHSRPLEVCLAPPKSLHDRLIIVDDGSAWILTQSLKDFAKRSHASIQKADDELAFMKRSAFNTLWKAGSLVAASTS